jgi:hypothetical protein
MRNCGMAIGRLFNGKVLFLAFAASAVSGASAARAALTLTLTEPGFAPQQYTDAVTPGQVSFFGSYGSFTTDIEIGLTNINTPTAPTAYLQIQSLDVTNNSSSANDLTVTLAETTPFTFPGNPSSQLTLTSALGGTITPATAGDTVSFQSTATPIGGSPVSDTIGSPPTYTAVGSTGAENVVIPTETANFTEGSGYTLQDVTGMSIAPGEAVNVSGTTSVTVAVPEPVTGGLLAGVAMLALGRRRRVR